MLPIAPLMIEHRLIERMIAILKYELAAMEKHRRTDPVLIDSVVDFIKTYADRTHHGKEEDILFRSLKKKPLSAEHAKAMDDLVQEHVLGRSVTKTLVAANERYRKGDDKALGEVGSHVRRLVEFYPMHIEKEDKHFFRPVMGYFSKAEQEAMLAECREFDRKMVHERYGRFIEGIEKERNLKSGMKPDWYGYI